MNLNVGIVSPFIFLFVLSPSFLFSSISFSQDSPWREKTLNDLQKIRSTLEANHPAFKISQESPEKDFLEWFESGFKIAKRRAEKVDSLFGYYFTLRAYGIGFKDEHLVVQVASFDRFKEQMKFRWPGFAVQLSEKNQIRISSINPLVANQVPPVGAVLLSCDGRESEAILNENVYPFYGDKRILKNRATFVPRIFVDSGNPFIQLPKACLFQKEGNTQSYPIKWTSISFEELWPKIDVSYDFKMQSTAAKTLDGDIHWVSLPTFAPNPKGEQNLRNIISEAKKNRKHKSLVVDLRGNGGGSSTWGMDVLKGYFGEEYIDEIQNQSQKTSQETYEYRVSKENLKYFEDLLGNATKNISKTDTFFIRVASEMRTALNVGKEVISIKLSDLDVQKSQGNKIQFLGKVFVLTDMYCASACLSVLDTIRLIPGAVHVGQETSADAVFMQSTFPTALSDPMIRFSFPVLRIRNRTRGNNSPVVPEVLFDGDMSNSTQIEQWIRKLVEKS
jgi:hypothetical protein